MEKSQKIQTIQQISIDQGQPHRPQTPKRQSMRKRLSQTKSIEDFFKTFSSQMNHYDGNKQQQLRPKKDKICFQLKSLAEMSNISLYTQVEEDPFLKRGIKFLAKNMKQNKAQPKNIGIPTPKFFQTNKISFRNYRQKVKVKQTQMVQKVINILEQRKFCA